MQKGKICCSWAAAAVQVTVPTDSGNSNANALLAANSLYKPGILFLFCKDVFRAAASEVQILHCEAEYGTAQSRSTAFPSCIQEV